MEHAGDWELDIGIPIKGNVTLAIELGEEIEGLVGKSHASGAGFGYRDLQIPFNTENEANEAQIKVLSFFKEKKIVVDREEGAYIGVNSVFNKECKCDGCIIVCGD